MDHMRASDGRDMRILLTSHIYLVQADRPERAFDYICYSSNGSDIRCADILARRPFTLYLQGSWTLYTCHSALRLPPMCPVMWLPGSHQACAPSIATVSVLGRPEEPLYQSVQLLGCA